LVNSPNICLKENFPVIGDLGDNIYLTSLNINEVFYCPLCVAYCPSAADNIRVF